MVVQLKYLFTLLNLDMTVIGFQRDSEGKVSVISTT